ncbi:hypothetical protein DPMN_102570 [Dreissena polymorpha]|uniref:Uncharacterized protein n=1 Tax=Dreissena polymorpha TaxID=45954 RepID=A0A9D4LJ98_DREPO|nr:hypothetical protein DPMN_102570 [Dreissena polymorpha]
MLYISNMKHKTNQKVQNILLLAHKISSWRPSIAESWVGMNALLGTTLCARLCNRDGGRRSRSQRKVRLTMRKGKVDVPPNG